MTVGSVWSFIKRPSTNPVNPQPIHRLARVYNFRTVAEPIGWKSVTYDDSFWPNAIAHSARDIDPKGGYDGIDWDSSAELLWSADLETDNTLLCRATIN